MDQSTIDAKTCISRLNRMPDVARVVELTAANIYRVEQCRGKDLVVFIGREQAGKSTAINNLRGVQFIEREDGKPGLVPIDSGISMAKMGEGRGVYCTVFPQVYRDSRDDFYYLDTQGFFVMTTKDPDEVATATVLLDAAIRNAKSVRLVYLEDFRKFNEGLTCIHDVLGLLNKIVLNANVPMLFLLNRFQPNTRTELINFITATPGEQNRMAMEGILAAEKRIVSAAEESINKQLKRLQNMAKRKANGAMSDLSADATEALGLIETGAQTFSGISSDELKSATIMEFNFEANRYSYINPLLDPADEWAAINHLRRVIIELPTVDRNSLAFNICNSERVGFNEGFEKMLRERLTPILKKVHFCFRYPPALIDKLRHDQNNDLEQNRQMLKGLKNEDLSQLLDELMEEERERLELQQKNNEGISDVIKQRLEDVNFNINRIENSDPVIVWQDRFEESVGFFSSGSSHTTIYEGKIPYIAVVEGLCEGTVRQKANFDLSLFEQEKRGDNSTLLKLRDYNNPVSSFEATYTSKKGIKTAGVLGIEIANAIIGGAAGLLCGFIAIPIVVTLSIPVGISISALQTRCIGCITFLGRYKDREQESLAVLEREKADLESLLGKGAEEIRKGLQAIKNSSAIVNELIQAESEAEKRGRIKRILNERVSRSQEMIFRLSEVYDSERKTLDEWNEERNAASFKTLKDMVESYNRVIGMLYNSPQERSESARAFSELFNQLRRLNAVGKNSIPEPVNVAPGISADQVLRYYDMRNL